VAQPLGIAIVEPSCLCGWPHHRLLLIENIHHDDCNYYDYRRHMLQRYKKISNTPTYLDRKIVSLGKKDYLCRAKIHVAV
jgi:hypothetical protein